MLRKNWNDLYDNGEKGDWYFFDNDTFMVIRWGDDKMDVVTIPIELAPREDRKTAWMWDGNHEAPTLAGLPMNSIRISGANGVELAHFFMTAGKIVPA